MLAITPIYTVFLVIILLFISFYTIVRRYKMRVALGAGDDLTLTRCMRAQANFCEYSPFFILMLGMAELVAVAPWALHLMGAIFVIGRVLHAYSILIKERYDAAGQLQGFPVFRFIGMQCTLNVLIALVVTLIVQYVL